MNSVRDPYGSARNGRLNRHLRGLVNLSACPNASGTCNSKI